MRKTKKIQPHISRDTAIALRNGDKNAYVIVYNSYVESLKSFLNHLTGSESESDILLQEIFIKVWECRDTIDPDVSIKSYLFKIAKETFLEHTQSRLNYSAESGGNYTDDDMLAKDTDMFIDIAVKSMPQPRQKVFMLFRNGASNIEIAKQLKLSEEDVEKYIIEARAEIKEVILLISYFLFMK